MGLRIYKSVLVALAVVALGGCFGTLESAGPATKAAVSQWLGAMASGASDRGWSMLSTQARNTYSNDPSAYEEETDATNWSAFRWSIADAYDNDGTWIVSVAVVGGWAAVPAFIRERPLAHLKCRDGDLIGLVVGVTFDGPGSAAVIHPLQGTGTIEAGECP